MIWCSSQAVRMDNWCPGNLTSSMADDIFFVLQKCIRWVHIVHVHVMHVLVSCACMYLLCVCVCVSRRALTSSNVDCTCAMLNHAR